MSNNFSGGKKLEHYKLTIDDTAKELSTDKNNGLCNDEALKRLEKYGENRLTETKHTSFFQKFLLQFCDVMIIILLIASAISFIIALGDGNPKEFFEPILILLIVIINAMMGVIQENKAEKSLDALKKLSSSHSRVIRNGSISSIDSTLLVPGDLILLEAGDMIPADARLITSNSLKCDESALTGESVASEKNASVQICDDVPLGDRINMVFSGCSVTYGNAKAIVCSTGMNTKMGHIANMLNNGESTQTPLSIKLAKLGKSLGIVVLFICFIIFVIGYFDGIPLLEIFMMSVSLAVSAIPEGLPAIVTIVLSIGVQRMSHKNAIIKHLPAVETLGSATVICSDKTGTLTQNRMTLMKAYIEERQSIEAVTSHASPLLRNLLQYAVLCCDGSICIKDNNIVHIGDPTETSIVLAAHKCNIIKEKLCECNPRVYEIPFDSDRKLMTCVCRIDNKNVVIVKGAFDVIEKRCNLADLSNAHKANEKLSQAALRVIAVAYKVIDEIPQTPNDFTLEDNLTFLGLLGMIDPPRPETAKSVALCRHAGIKPVMITGDHITTASAIAQDIGILQNGERAVTGMELDRINDDELDRELENISVYARVSPENKIRIVKAWQRKGAVVAMTGDGVNDAPALKASDIGCAMGITGTDVSKEAADMILTDDNFATIVEAVREGRSIYSNIKKVVGFLLGTNIGEVLSIFFAMLLWRKMPLLSMQLLWINLVTDSFPAIALGMEPVEASVMDAKPTKKDESIFANGLGIRIILQGAMFGLLSLISFYIGEHTTKLLSGGQTMMFITLSVSQIVQAFNMRSNRSLFTIGFFSNKKLNMAAGTSAALVLLVLLTPLSAAFELILLPFNLYIMAFALALVPLLIMEAVKLIRRLFTPSIAL